MALLPLVHDDFDPILKARYLMPLVPLVYAVVGVVAAKVLLSPPLARARLVSRVGLGAIGVVVLGGMLNSLLRFEFNMLAHDCTNIPQRAFVTELERYRRPGEWVVIDEGSVRACPRPAARLRHVARRLIVAIAAEGPEPTP